MEVILPPVALDVADIVPGVPLVPHKSAGATIVPGTNTGFNNIPKSNPPIGVVLVVPKLVFINGDELT